MEKKNIKKNEKKGLLRKKKTSSEYYIVERFSVLRDYIVNKPKAILFIVADQKKTKELEELTKNLRVDICDDSSWQSHKSAHFFPSEASPPQVSVWALVRVVPLLEGDFSFKLSKKSPRLVLALDHIKDPRNLGAIVRSAAFFGVTDLLTPKDRQVLLTPSSVATAQGGFSSVDLVIVTNLVRTIKEFKKRGYWVIGADVNGEALSEKTMPDFDKVLLVLGSEDLGLSALVKKNCDLLLSIKSYAQSLNSLNVSVAAGIFMNYFSSYTEKNNSKS